MACATWTALISGFLLEERKPLSRQVSWPRGRQHYEFGCIGYHQGGFGLFCCMWFAKLVIMFEVSGTAFCLNSSTWNWQRPMFHRPQGPDGKVKDPSKYQGRGDFFLIVRKVLAISQPWVKWALPGRITQLVLLCRKQLLLPGSHRWAYWQWAGWEAQNLLTCAELGRDLRCSASSF